MTPGSATSRISPSRTASCSRPRAAGGPIDARDERESRARSLLAALDGGHICGGSGQHAGAGAPMCCRPGATSSSVRTRRRRRRPSRRTRGARGGGAAAILQEHGDWPRSLVIRFMGQRQWHQRRGDRARPRADGCRRDGMPLTGGAPASRCAAAALGWPRVGDDLRISGPVPRHVPAHIAFIDAADLRGRRARRGRPRLPLRRGGAPRQPAAPRVRLRPHPGAGIEELLRAAVGAERERSATPSWMLPRTLSAAWTARRGRARRLRPRFARGRAAIDTGDVPTATSSKARPTSPSSAAFRRHSRPAGRKPTFASTRPTVTARARSCGEAVARFGGRRLDPRFIHGQMWHGRRGGAESAETVDRLVGFAGTTDAVPSDDRCRDTLSRRPPVRDFMLRENTSAARYRRAVSAARGADSAPARDSLDDDLVALVAEACSQEFSAGMTALLPPPRADRPMLCSTDAVPVMGLLVRLQPLSRRSHAGNASPDWRKPRRNTATAFSKSPARGSLQIRGLTARLGGERWPRDVDALGIAVRDGRSSRNAAACRARPAGDRRSDARSSGRHRARCVEADRGARRTARAEGFRRRRWRRPTSDMDVRRRPTSG